MFKKVSLILLLFFSCVVFSQIPTYYNDVNLNLSGTALRDELSTKVINTHTTFLSYGWTTIQQTDLDPADNTKVLLIYGSNDSDGNYVTDRTRSVNSNGGTAGTDWNREHTYARSLGNPNLGTSGPGADVHHLRASDVTLNNNRGSLKFITGSGVAGTSGAGWYPGDEWKGDVARMMMYMYLRYGSQCLPSGVAIGTTNSVDANMIDLLLDWNAEDPVSQYETNRNNILESAQGNRNPFIDNPAFATEIWGGTQAEDKFLGASVNQEINVLGNSISIVSGSTAASTLNNTNFGTVDTASGSVVKTFTIENTGGATLTLSSNPSISTGNSTDFSVTANPSLSLAAGTSTTFQITFDPSADGVRSTTVTILSNDADEGTYTFNISGTGNTSGGSGTGSCGAELFISEYIEGSSNNKFIEIYNPSNASINLSSYDLVSYTNGSSSVSNTLSLSGTIAAESTFVIGNNSETLSAVPDLPTTNGVMQFNGDDVVALRKSGAIIDVIGQIGVDPGAKWPGTCGAQNVTLIRNSTITAGDTNGSDAFTTNTEWTCLPQDDVSNLGSHTISCTSATSEIDVLGNTISIPSGSIATSLTNDTDFGLVDTASGTIVKTFTIENSGNATLTLSQNPSIATGDATDFSITSNPSLSISGSSSTTFQVTFNPSADGVRSTVVTILSDDSDEGSYTFTISGEGTSNSSVPCGTELFISEYIEGTNQNKFLEIYNPTGSSINLSGYDIVTYVNGSTTISQTLPLSGFIASEGTFVIENSAESLGVTADLSVVGGVMDFSGNDVVALRNSGTFIDVIGQIGVDLGASWAGTCSTQGNTLIRKDSFGAGDTNGNDSFTTDTEWTCTTADDVSNLGSHTLNCTNGPEIILQGNSVDITNASAVTSVTNNTFFGSVNVSSGSIVKTFSILNTGTSTLTLSQNPTITGANSADFSITSNPNLSIPSGSSTTFQVTFNPSASGTRSALVTILSDDADEGTFTFAIEGSGTTGAVSCSSLSGATLFSQNFETVPATPTLTYSSTNTSFSSGTGSFPSENMFSEGVRGLQVNNATATVEFATFDSSNYSNAEFSVKLASFAVTSGNGADAADYVKVFVSTDNGTTYSEEVTINGASSANSKWSFTSGTGEASVVYDGNNTTTSFAPAGSGDRTTDGYSTVKVTSLPQSSTLKIKIEIKNNSGNEYWVIDDVKIIGDSESVAIWNGVWTGATPAENVKMVINSDLDLTSLPNIDACECEIKTGSTLTIASDKYLKVQNNIINNGTIIVEDGGNVIQVSDVSTITGTGNFVVKRTTTNLPSKYVFTYWSSPLTSATLAQVALDAGAYYSFNSTSQSWSFANKNTGMIPGVGYIVQGPSSGVSYPSSYTAEFTGSSFNNGVIDVSLNLGESTYNGASDNWNLIGNPYPSAIDANLFMAANPEISGTIYFWTHNTDASTTKNFSQNDYVSWNGTGGTAGCTGCIAPTGTIASGQGFFAQALNSSSTITFNNSMRLGQNNTNFYKSNNQKEAKIWLNLSSENSFNQILVGFLKEATNGLDRLYDGEKLDGGTNANFYSLLNDKQLVIQGKSILDGKNKTPLGFSTKNAGNFKISIEKSNGNLQKAKIMLVDKLLGIKHNLTKEAYSFSTELGTFNDRFVLLIKPKAKTKVKIKRKKTLNFEKTGNTLSIYHEDFTINSIKIYTILGKLIKQVEVNNKNAQVELKSKNSQILIVKTTYTNGEVAINKIFN